MASDSKSITFNNVKCHTDSPTLGISGTITITRDDTSSSTVRVTSSSLRIHSYYNASWTFKQGEIRIAIFQGSTRKVYTTHNYSSSPHTGSGSVSYSFNDYFDLPTGSGSLKVKVECRYTSSGCQISSANDEYEVGSIDIPEYEPYRRPVLSFDSPSPGSYKNRNANQKFTIHYNSSTGLYTPASSSYYITINDGSIGVTGTLSNNGGTVSLDNLENYYSASRDGKSVKIIGTRVGKGSTGSVTTTANIGNILWKPRVQIANPRSSINQEIIYDRVDIKYTWDNYPADNGISDKVHIQIFRGKDKNSITEKVYDVTDINYSDKSFTIQSEFYSSLYYYKVYIYPRYSKQGLDGPAWISNPFMLISKLKNTSIDYPTTAYGDINWIGSRFFICFQLPEDPDVKLLGGFENYNYKDIKIKIIDSNYNVLGDYSFNNNKDMFSCNSLTYRRKVIFSNKISGINVSSTPVTVKIDVYKDVENADQEMVKSSASIIINRRQLIKYEPNKDSIIKQSDFINLVEQILKISISYVNVQGIYADTYHTITLDNIDNLRQPRTGSNDFININMACYQNLRSLLSTVLETITSYTNGTIDNSSFSVNFPVIDAFIDLQNKFITADKETTSQYGNTNGGNYIKYGYNWIKNLMNDTDYNSFLPYNI